MSQTLSGSFHEAISTILKMIQYFGLLPVQGITKNNVHDLNFNWKCFKTFYSIIFIIISFIEFSALFYEGIIDGFSLTETSSLSFYLICTSSVVNLFILARKWPKLMIYWYDHEKLLLQPPYFVQGWSLKRKIRIVALLFAFMAFCKYYHYYLNIMSKFNLKIIFRLFAVEHFLYLTAVIYDNQKIIEWCNVNESEYFHSYAIKQHHNLLRFVPYHPIEILLFEVMLIQLKILCWNIKKINKRFSVLAYY